jgi:GT2 family glycosyltransferase
MDNVVLDIMLPFYGDPEMLRIAVASIIAQDDSGWRLTVVDDGYPDETIPGWFADLGDDRIRYFRNEKNLGANRNYHRCVELIDHELAVIMGADDKMLPNYVRTVRQAFREFPDAGFAQPGVRVIDEHGLPVRTLVDEVKRKIYAPRGSGRRIFSGEWLARSLLRGDWLYFPSVCWRSDALRHAGFRDGFNVVQDLALAIDLVQQGESLIVDDAVCFEYRRHQASDSSLRALAGDRFVEERRYFIETAATMRELGWHRAARSAQLHLSSRIHALTFLPKAARHHHRSGMRSLANHAFGAGR